MCVTDSFTTVCCVPSKGLPGDERRLAAAFRQIRVVQKRAGSKKEKITGAHRVGGGGSLGVAQVASGGSIEGSRGSRICGGRAVRRGHGGIS